MFNSSLLGISQEINNGRFDRYCPIVEAVYKTHNEIIHDAIAEWKMFGFSDEEFDEYFEDIFPPGFISRDRNKAKQIIYDLRDIAEGEAIRFELAPIYSYVMYNLIRNWCEMLEESDQLKSNFPLTIKNYLKEKAISPRSDIYRSIKSWFTSPNKMLYDFGDTYNEDYMHEDFAENIASIYLDDEYAKEKLDILGVEVDGFVDLLPNDLYMRVQQKQKEEQERKDRVEKVRDNSKQGTEEKVVFISYSWEDEEHRKWVKSLADRLISDGINVNIDQYDLSLGDRLPQFMEEQISQATYVLIICTPIYKEKSDARKGGVGYEGHIISGELLTQHNERKFIPVIRKGNVVNAMPICLVGKYGVDLSNNDDYEEKYKELVHTLKGMKRKPELQQSISSYGEHIVKIKREIEKAIIDRSRVKTNEDRLSIAREPWRKIRANNIMLKDEMIENPDYNNGLIKAEPYGLYDDGVLLWNPFGTKRITVKRKGREETFITHAYVVDKIPFRNISAVDENGSENYPYPTLYCRFTNNSPYAGKKYIDKETYVEYDESEVIDVQDE